MGKTARGLRDWREMLTANNTESTAHKYVVWARRFEWWLDGEPDPGDLAGFDALLRDGDALAAIEPGDFGAWRDARPPRDGYAYASRVMAVSAAKSWMDFRYGVEFGDRQRHKVQNIVRGEAPAFDPDIADRDEIERVIRDTADCHSDSCHAMTVTGYDAIMRGVELCRAEWGDLDPGKGTLYVRAAKGSESRHVRLHDSTLEVLRGYRDLVRSRFDDPQYLFYSFYQHHYNRPWSPRAWSKHFYRNHYEPGFHAFARHTAITRRLENGESLTAVNQRARHSTLEMTSRYNQLASNGASPLPELE